MFVISWFQFVTILNSKKAKLRELRDQLSKQATTPHQLPEEEAEESTDRTESFDEGSEDEEGEKNSGGYSKGATATSSSSKPRGRKRK